MTRQLGRSVTPLSIFKSLSDLSVVCPLASLYTDYLNTTVFQVILSHFKKQVNSVYLSQFILCLHFMLNILLCTFYVVLKRNIKE